MNAAVGIKTVEKIAGLPWVWEFPWEFPWVWEWDGYGNGDEFPWELWEFLSGCEIKQKRVKYAINVTVDV